MEKQELSKSEKFWRSCIGKCCRCVFNFIYDMMFDCFNKPSIAYGGEQGAPIFVNYDFEDQMRTYNEGKRQQEETKKNFWRKRMGYSKADNLSKEV